MEFLNAILVIVERIVMKTLESVYAVMDILILQIKKNVANVIIHGFIINFKNKNKISLTCDEVSTNCTSCDNLDHRTIDNYACPCNTGYYNINN